MTSAKLTLSAAVALVLGAGAASAQNDCAAGKTLKEGVRHVVNDPCSSTSPRLCMNLIRE